MSNVLFLLGIGALIGLFFGLMRVKEKEEEREWYMTRTKKDKSENQYIVFISIVAGMILIGIFMLLISG